MSYQVFQGIALHLKLQDHDVLSIGGYNGLHAASCLERGAKSVTVVDNGQWRLYNWSPPEQFPGVRYVEADVHDWHEPADIVEFNNVIYHVKDPWTTMEHIRKLTKYCLVLTTSFIPGEHKGWEIQPYDPKNGPRHVYWKPTLEGLYELLRCTGFEQWETVGTQGDHIVMRCKPT